MHNLLRPGTVQAIQERLTRIGPDSKARWGRMNAGQMLTHCAAQLELATGEIRTEARRSPLGWPLVKHALIYFVPWPKNAPTAPALLRPDPDQLAAAREALSAAVDRFRSHSASRLGVHPLFGRLSRRTWGRLAFRHLDHHLRQFGV